MVELVYLELHGDVFGKDEDVRRNGVPVGLPFAVKRSKPLDDAFKT